MVSRVSFIPTGRRFGVALVSAIVLMTALAGCSDDRGDTAGEPTTPTTPSTEVAETTVPASTSTTAPPLPDLVAEANAAPTVPDGTVAATINNVGAVEQTVGLNPVTVERRRGTLVAVDEIEFELADVATDDGTEILLEPNGGGPLLAATQRQFWDTLGKKDTGFDLGDSSVVFVTVAGGRASRIEQRPDISIQS